jgi:solute carrier family 25 folate transporter 32
MLRQRTGQVELSAPLNFLSATMAGVTTALVCNPIWMVKTRLQIQQENPLKRVSGAALTAAEAALMKPYTGTIDAFSRIVKEEGIFALYRGIIYIHGSPI